MKKYIQYISDIHLEFYKKKIPTIEPLYEGVSYLALLGDIGYPVLPSYEKFLTHHASIFKEIIVIAGNHEFYSGINSQKTITVLIEKIVEICSKFNNVTFLNNSSKLIGNTLFIGTTLWSDVQLSKELLYKKNDYNKIYVKTFDSAKYIYRPTQDNFGGMYKKISIKKGRSILTPYYVRSMHEQAVDFIKSEIEKSLHDVIVLTHHAPTFKVVTDENDPINTCYATNLEYLMHNQDKVKYWLFGHIHHNISIKIGNVQCATNCMGYRDEKCANFDEKKYIEFE